MATLKTTYAGLELKNPIIVGASNLVLDEVLLKKLEDSGASAIVYKSLFEEQIQLENMQHDNVTSEYTDRHPEMVNLFPKVEDSGAIEFLYRLEKSRKLVTVPLIASQIGRAHV